MATELRLAPNWQLVREETGAVAIDGALNDTTHPMSTAFNPGKVDYIAIYWEAAGGVAAVPGDTISLEVLIRNNNDATQAWVKAAAVSTLAHRAVAVVPVYQCPRCHIRVTAISLAGASEDLQIFAIKLAGPPVTY